MVKQIGFSRSRVSTSPSTEEIDQARRDIAPLELFFDLVYVFAIGQLAAVIAAVVIVGLAAFEDRRRAGDRNLKPSTLPSLG